RALAAGVSFFAAEGVDLIALQLGVLHGGCEYDGPAFAVDGHGNFVARWLGMTEELPHHPDHVLERVVVVVPENHVIPRLRLGWVVLGPRAGVDFRRRYGNVIVLGHGLVGKASEPLRRDQTMAGNRGQV